MNIIFIHGNYPGQFKHLISNMEGVPNVRTYFLTEREETIKTKSTRIIKMKPHRGVSAQTHHYLTATEECIIRGQAVIRTIMDLKEKGISIDVVICHGGMGYGLFIKDYLPKTIVISYNEWFFTEKNSESLFADYTFDNKLMTRTRNFTTLSEIESCDIAICPTEWQKRQFPKVYWEKLKVIYDGIDHNFFNNKGRRTREVTIRNRESGEEFKLGKDEIIISYATRGMEPLRCFPEFMRAIPYLTQDSDKIRIVIAGADKAAYSYKAPNHNGSWKEHELEKMSAKTRSTITFTGLLDWEDYRTLLKRSDLHCYFSKPYVLSWSFIESAACGINIATNPMDGMKEAVEEGSVHWFDINDPKELSRNLKSAIENRKEAKLSKNFILKEYLQNWQNAINNIILTKK